jgi:cellobiose transport system substrate-binding protein
MPRRSTTKVRLLRVGVAAAAVALLASACLGPGADDGKIRLTVGTFGDFGYSDLYRQFEAMHPNVEVVEHVSAMADHHKNLAAHLATNSGANDVEAIEESYISAFKAAPGRFVNLLDLGAGELREQWLPWKWAQSASADGSVQIGLGTDMGGLAMCYRRDLFEQAGLPTDRDEVSALWPDWKSYLATGQRFAAAEIPGTYWFDSAGNIFSAVLNQAETGVYDKRDNLVVKTNPAVEQAFTLAAGAATSNLSARLTPFSPPWNTGFSKGTFATVTCPAWMMGYIQDQAKSSAGLWDIAAIPGGGGNWGGSFLTVPKQSEHPELAYALARFLTSPQSQAYVFKQTGNLPSAPELYDDKSIAEFTNPFFSGAPVGEIFTGSARQLEPQYQGPKAADVKIALGRALGRVEEGKESPAAAWAKGLREAERLIT